MMDKVQNVDLSEVIEHDIENRVFARMCQILSAHRNRIGIYFKTMDNASSEIATYDYSKLPESVIDKVKMVNKIEFITGKVITTQDDFLKGEINSDLCKGKRISFSEDNENAKIIIKLMEDRGVEE